MNRLLILLSVCACVHYGCNSQENASSAEPEIAEVVTPEMARLDSLTELLDKAPGNAALLNERAKAFLAMNQNNFALADVGRALMIDSTVSDYYLTISDVYFRLNRAQQCKNALLKANQLDPTDMEALYRLAQFELYLSEHQKSINYANDMLRIDPRDDRPFVIKALCFKELGDTAKSIQNYLEAVSQNPDNYDAYVELGILHWGRKDPLAEQYLKSALSIRPEGIDALYALGMHYQTNDKLNEALETYVQIIRIDSTYREAYFNMGYVQYEFLQLYDEALKNFELAVKADPKYYQAVYMRGLCYEAKGDVARAKREYSYAIELNSDYAKAADGLNRLIGKMPK